MAKPYTENFRVNLRTLCDLSSVSAVAENSGVSRITLSRIIHGHIVPSLETAERIANASGISLERLLANPKKLANSA